MPVVEQANFATGDGVANIDQTFSLGSYSNSLLLVGASINNDNFETISAMTWNLTSLNFLGSVETIDDARVEIWYMTAPAVGTYTLECDFSATLLRQAIVGYLVVSGVNQATPLGTMASTASQAGAGTNVGISVASAVDDLVFACLAGETITSATAGTGQTDQWNTNVISNTWGAGSTKAGAAGSTTMSYTLGSDDHRALAGVAIKAAAGGNVALYRRRLEIY